MPIGSEKPPPIEPEKVKADRKALRGNVDAMLADIAWRKAKTPTDD